MMPKSFITLILLLGAVIIGVFYLRPQWQSFQDLRKSSEHLEELSREFDILIQNRDSLVGLINTVSKKDLERIDKALPKGSQAGEVLVILENMVGRHGLTLPSIGLQSASEPASETKALSQIGVKSADAIREFPVDLNIKGSYESFKNFLVEIEKNLRITDATSLSFGALSGADDKINFNARIKMYYQ